MNKRKILKKILVVVLALVTAFASAVPAFAAVADITIPNIQLGDVSDEIVYLLKELGIDATAADVDDLMQYIVNGGKLDEWLEAKYGKDGASSVVYTAVVAALKKIITLATTTTTVSTTDFQYVPSSNATTGTTSATRFTTSLIYPSGTTEKASESEEQTGAERETGDVNGDGKVNAADARLVLRASAQLIILDNAATAVADVNGDGKITSKDARSVLRYSAGLINYF